MENKKISNYDLQVDIARNIFVKYDQKILIRKFHLTADSEWLYLKYLGMPFRICRKSGRIEECFSEDGWKECRSFNTVMTIYDLLCYSKGEEIPVLSGSWCTTGSVFDIDGQNSESFTKKYAKLFQNHVEELKRACQSIGGIVELPFARADVTCRIPVTSFFEVVLQFWEGDEEFSPKLLLLWDKNFQSFLHYETTFYLQNDLLEQVAKNLKNI